MKKSLFLLPLAAFALAGCGNNTPTTCNHVDANKDHKCDTCGTTISQHADTNPLDHKCDTCGNSLGTHSYSYDNYDKHKCACGDVQNCVDANADGKCDICGHEMKVAPIVGENFDITYDSIDFSSMSDAQVYFDSSVNFSAGGVVWETSPAGSDSKGTFGRPSPTFDPGFYELKLFQMKKTTGYMFNKSGVTGFTKLTITWYNTYATEETKYFPVVQQGSDADSLNTVSANETETATGKDTGKYKDSAQKYKIYEYVNTYNLSSDKGFYKICAGAGALYASKIAFTK